MHIELRVFPMACKNIQSNSLNETDDPYGVRIRATRRELHKRCATRL